MVGTFGRIGERVLLVTAMAGLADCTPARQRTSARTSSAPGHRASRSRQQKPLFVRRVDHVDTCHVLKQRSARVMGATNCRSHKTVSRRGLWRPLTMSATVLNGESARTVRISGPFSISMIGTMSFTGSEVDLLEQRVVDSQRRKIAHADGVAVRSLARAMASVPMLPPAPTLLSMMIGCPRIRLIEFANLAGPAVGAAASAIGLIQVIGLFGYLSCANSAPGNSAAPAVACRKYVVHQLNLLHDAIRIHRRRLLVALAVVLLTTHCLRIRRTVATCIFVAHDPYSNWAQWAK